MPGEEEILESMAHDFIHEVNVVRRQNKQPPLSERAQGVLQDLLQQPGGAREHLLPAIESGNLQMLMTSVGGGQGMYAAGVRALGVNPDSLEQAGADPSVVYNLNFTLAHESRHARDRGEIVAMTETMLEAVIAKAQDPLLPHDYTQIARDYLDRDRVLEQRAETAGLNAHVSRVQAEMDGAATLRDVYERSPRDMAAYIDVTPPVPPATDSTYAYKPGFVVHEDGLHVDAGHPSTLDAMGRYFYDEQNYDWRQGLRAVLDAVNNAESGLSTVRDPRYPPRIDFETLQVGPPPDAMSRNGLQQVVDSSLRGPNMEGHPDHAFFVALQERFPAASADVVGHAMLKAKVDNIESAADVDWGGTGPGPDGRIWVTGRNGRNVDVDPMAPDIPPLIKTTQALENRASERREAEAERLEQAQHARGNCVIL